MIRIKTETELEKMRVSNRMTAEVLAAVAGRVAPGITTGELDRFAGEMIRDMGGTPAFLGYGGYPASICVSINEQVVHGIPGRRVIGSGDVVSIDVGVKYDGFIGDCATTVLVDVDDREIIRLAAVTREALAAGIDKAVVGGRLSDISHAVEKTVTAAGFSVVRDFVGHGIGRDMHEEPQVPNFGRPGRGPKLAHGMTIAIEPMVNQGGCEVEVMPDGWTVLTRDRRPSVHFEHTIAVLKTGPEILTCVKKKI